MKSTRLINRNSKIILFSLFFLTVKVFIKKHCKKSIKRVFRFRVHFISTLTYTIDNLCTYADDVLHVAGINFFFQWNYNKVFSFTC